MLHKHIKLLSDLLRLSIVTGVIRPSELFAPNVHLAEYSGFLLLRTFSFYSDFFLKYVLLSHSEVCLVSLCPSMCHYCIVCFFVAAVFYFAHCNRFMC